MRIQHNILAMNSYRNYTNNTNALGKNLEKLSSGYKINRAGDDAAGLAISEKMRAQIQGLSAAQKNVKDGISLVKTAEGAMQEIQDMLSRMKYLATQSANGTYDDEVDRANLQQEVDNLKAEIDRIAQSANFNGKELLYKGPAADESDDIPVPYAGGGEVTGTPNASIAVDGSEGTKATVTYDLTGKDDSALDTKKIDGETISWVTDLNTTMNNFVTAYNSNTHDYEASWDEDSSTLTLTAKDVGEKSSAPATDIGGVSGSLSPDGTAAVPATKTINAGGLNLANIASVADGKAGIANGKVTLVENDSGYLEIRIGDITIGTSTEKIAEAAGNTLTFTSDGTANGTALGSVTLTGTFAAEDIKNKGALDTGLTYAVGGGNGDGDGDGDDDVKKTPANVDVISDPAIGAAIKDADPSSDSLKDVGITDAILDKIGTVKVGGEVEIDLAKALEEASIDDENANLGDFLSAIENAAKDAIEKWNTANEEAKGYSYKYVGLSTDGTEEGIVTLADTGLTILVNKLEPKKDTPPSDIYEPIPKGEDVEFTLQIGDTGDKFNQLNITIKSMDCESIGIDDLYIGDLTSAQAAVDSIKDAINTVSMERGKLGALQNRLEHTQNNLSVMAENIQDAESTIRDTDVADEMMGYVKNNILVQSAQAMLAQANQVPQGVLQLLG